jgi:16S rRNA (cytosine967-C5)-methyltransferase
MTEQGTDTKARTYDPVRAAAVEAVVLIEQGEQSEAAIQKVMAGRNFRPVDRRFLTQLVNGTTKMRRRLDHMIRFYLARPSTELPIKLTNILRIGFYQLYFTDRIPAAAAVSESVNLALHMTGRSRASLVNAVMRTSLREPHRVKFADKHEDPLKYLGDYYSFPDFFVEYCLREFGPEKAESLLESYNRPPQVTYRVNFLKAKPDEVANILQNNKTEFSYGKYLPEFIHIEEGGLPLEDELVKTGKVLVQDESAGLAVRLLNPRPGNNVLDIAAAPGGKTTYMAIRMRNKGRVTAVDKSHSRLEMLVENSKRLGIKIVAPVACDIFEFQSEPFDRVLVDPPCSGWGTAGKHSDLRWAKTEEDFRHLARIQSHMLDRAANLVKPGGTLVYSTCTIIREENDQVIEEFLLRNRIGKLDGAFCARLKRHPA